MKRKYWFLAVGVLLVLFLFLIASVPRIAEIKSVDVTQIGEYPGLCEAYTDLCAEYPLYEIETENTICIVTVKNLWGSWQRYVLPCFAAETRTVPRAGNGTFTAFMRVLAPWSQENIFTRICPLNLVLNLQMTPGENTFVSQKFKAIPDNAYSDDSMIMFDGGIDCNKQPDCFVYYTVATSSSADEYAQETSATFRWNYFLKFSRKQLRFGDFSLEKTYIVNG